jgi:hypothetical protein
LSDKIIELKHSGNIYELRYFGRKILFGILKCTKQNTVLEEELKLYNKYFKTYTLIPEKLLETDLQVLQGIIHFHIYSEALRRIKNKGLLLSMLILGRKQLRDVIDDLNNSYQVSKNYYVIVIIVNDKIEHIPGNCIYYRLSFENPTRKDYEVLSKNIQTLLDTM